MPAIAAIKDPLYLLKSMGRLHNDNRSPQRTRPLAVRLCRSQLVCQPRHASIERIKPCTQVNGLLKVFCLDGVLLLLLQLPLFICEVQGPQSRLPMPLIGITSTVLQHSGD